jgi:F0F1-type ATP synthase membrane subunit b/b'
MSDDLIKRLLAEETDLTDCAADRIEQLEAKLAKAEAYLQKIRRHANRSCSAIAARALAELEKME